VAAESGGRRPGIRAGDGQWRRLGELLQRRREELGYDHRPAFSEERDINIRRVADIERNYRPNTYPIGALAKIARAYAVTYESVTAILRGEAGELAPEAPAASPGPAPGPGWPPPPLGAARVAAAAPYTGPIWERIAALAARGVTDPSGADVFPASSRHARAWDATAEWWPAGDRVWMVADLQARRASPPGSREDAAS
jgi:hypothetical protein